MHYRRVTRPRAAVVALLALALTTGLVIAAAPAAVPASSGLGKVDARVLRAVQGGKSATYWAILSTRADLSGASAITDWNARGWYVYNRLTKVANATQRGLRAMLKAQGVSYQPFWLLNAVRITSKAGTLKAVAARKEVARVLADRVYKLPPIQRTKAIATYEWNIINIKADQVHSTYNARGVGVTVANIDTGVQFTHPALRRQYRGVQTPGGPTLFVNHNYAWWDPSRVCHPQGLQPCDNNGHGTHTMGTMVGDDGGTNQIGVAPGATWIAAKGCETNSCSEFALLSSAQWITAPTNLNGQNPRPDLRPHAVNNSWAGGGGDPWYMASVDGWVAAGIFPQFAIGNSGPSCGSADSPGDYPQSYGAGAYNINNQLASFSSRGPSAFGGEIKPNIAAPGVQVRSSVPTNGYASFSGTSMASPHVAGTVALIWGQNGAPSFSRNIAATRGFLDDSAVDVNALTCGGTMDDNNMFGEGRLDALEAVERAKGISD